MSNRIVFILLPLSLLSFACTWAPLSQLGEKVRLLEPHEVASCTKKGKTTVYCSFFLRICKFKWEVFFEEAIKAFSNFRENMTRKLLSIGKLALH